MPVTTFPSTSYFPPAGSPQPGAKRPVRQLGHTGVPDAVRGRALLAAGPGKKPVRQVGETSVPDLFHEQAMNRQAEPAYIARHYLQPPWRPQVTPQSRKP
jgi:hypothetical protein